MQLQNQLTGGGFNTGKMVSPVDCPKRGFTKETHLEILGSFLFVHGSSFLYSVLQFIIALVSPNSDLHLFNLRSLSSVYDDDVINLSPDRKMGVS